MNTIDFLGKLAENSKNYDAFEYQTLLKIIRYCDTDTRFTFFPNAEFMCGYDFGYPEVTIKLICYTISTIADYGFNQAVVLKSYPESVGCLFRGHAERWTDIFKRFIADIHPGIMDEAFLNSVFEAASTEQFIIGTLMKMEVESEQTVRLIFEFIRCFLEHRFDEFVRRWEKAAGPQKIEQFKHTDYFSAYLRDDKLALGIKDDITNAISRKTSINKCKSKMGMDVENWLDSDLVKQYGLRSEEKIKNLIDESVPYSGGCVSAETMITLADGTQKQICKIKEGDLVLSEEGKVSRTSDELVTNRHLDRLYGLNDMPPFMSFEHAVMTQDGWKSLDPSKSNEINPHFHVGRLKEGDVVITLTGRIKVERISVRFAGQGESFTGYDLHFREGQNSYFANGLLVLLNYPEITGSRIFHNLKSMEPEDRRRFIELVYSNEKLFNKVFGIDIINYFKENVNENFKNNFGSIT